jgi:hypothetical protein
LCTHREVAAIARQEEENAETQPKKTTVRPDSGT